MRPAKDAIDTRQEDKAFIGNPVSKKVHATDCRMAPSRQPIHFRDLNTALKRGYSKCRFCLEDDLI